MIFGLRRVILPFRAVNEIYGGKALSSNSKKYIIVAIIIVISLAVVYFSALNRENTLTYDSAVGFIAKPVMQLFGGVSEEVSDFLSYFKNKKDIMNKNYELDNKLMELERENSKLKSLENENERLRNMLEFKDKNPGFNLLAGKVISKDTSNYYSTFLIDKGKKDGVQTNMPIVGSKGLIGYVVETSNTFSKVQTIIEGGSSVGCVVSRTGATAVTEGSTILLKDGLMRMIYVSKEMNLVEGDIIETSGLGQIYPEGIAIGRIKEIEMDNITKSQYAIIKPVEDFEFIREIFVITNYSKTGE